MTSSDNSAVIEQPWPFRTDSWLSDALHRDTQTLTKALQKSFSDSDSPDTPTPSIDSLPNCNPHPNPYRNPIPVSSSPKVSKRKSRASKRTLTTFITADPANFRQMVQQVTGVRFSNSQLPPILKPEPQRLRTRSPVIPGGCLPTLDTSAFLLDHHQQQVVMESGSGHVGDGSAPFPFQSSAVADGGGVGLDFDPIHSFPTLESWKVM